MNAPGIAQNQWKIKFYMDSKMEVTEFGGGGGGVEWENKSPLPLVVLHL
jgi:hypothetical protein